MIEPLSGKSCWLSEAVIEGAHSPSRDVREQAIKDLGSGF